MIQTLTRSGPLPRLCLTVVLVVAGSCTAPVERSKTSTSGTTRASSSARAVASPAEQIIALAQHDNRVMATERAIAKEHPKRLTGSKGFDAAAEWALEQFRSYGLEAHLETWGELPIAFDRGAQTGCIVAPGRVATEGEPLVFATMAWTAGTRGPERGPAVLEPRTEEELAKLDPRKDFAHAWIVRTESKEGAKFRRKLRDAYAEAGILGTLRRGAANGLLGMYGNSRVDPAKLPTQVDAKVLAAQYDALVARLERGEKLDVQIDSENIFGAAPAKCTNVVADLKGTRFPDEYVLVQGHFDAWDGAEGAQDNGTGSATTLEAARLITAAGLRPLRTIRFVLYSGEEEGLFGSKGYVRDHAAELPKVSVVMTHDAGGTYLAGIDATYAMLDDITRVCAPLTTLDPRFPFQVHEVDGLLNSDDSDHAPFIAAGVPSFFWHQSEKDYEHVHHTQFDTLDAVDPAQLEHSAVVVAVAAIGFADLDHLLDRTDMKPVARRRLGVHMDETGTLQQVVEDGRADKAGWKQGDRIVAIDGEQVSTQTEVLDKLQAGSGHKTFRLERDGQMIETVIDYAGEAGETERAERAARRAAFRQAHERN